MAILTLTIIVHAIEFIGGSRGGARGSRAPLILGEKEEMNEGRKDS